MGSAADLLRAGANRSRDDVTVAGTGWPKNPRALAGRLRRGQTFLRALGIDISFSREGRAGSRVIRMRTTIPSAPSAASAPMDRELGQHNRRRGRPVPLAITAPLHWQEWTGARSGR